MMNSSNEALLRRVFDKTTSDSERPFIAAWNICKVSGHDDKILIRAIVTYFDSTANFVELMKWVVSKEVEIMHVSEGTVPFREDSISTALLLHFGETSRVCLVYLKRWVKPIIYRIKEMSSKQGTQQGEFTQESVGPSDLLNICGDLVNNITSNATSIPIPYLEIMKHISYSVNRRFPGGMGIASIVAVFLLRFVFRAIIFPELYFSAFKKVSFQFRKNLIKVSKMLQKLSSVDDTAPEEDILDMPEGDPGQITDFVKVCKTKIKDFLVAITRSPSHFKSQQWGLSDGIKNANKVIAAHILDYEDHLRAEVPGLLPNSISVVPKTKSRANSAGDIDVETLSNLNACLNNIHTRELFYNFSKAEHSENPLLFWIDADKYAKNPSLSFALEIWRNYLEPGGPERFGAELKLRNVINESIQNNIADATLFAKVQNSAFAVMATDSHVRFVQSMTSLR